MNKAKEILIELIPVIILLILICFFRTELEITIFAAIAMFAAFKIKYQKREIHLLLFGAIMGVIFESIGNSLLGQSWPQASFFAIPIWLPLTWGYGFILIRRIGNIIIK
jgi:hypothetical protein